MPFIVNVDFGGAHIGVQDALVPQVVQSVSQLEEPVGGLCYGARADHFQRVGQIGSVHILCDDEEGEGCDFVVEQFDHVAVAQVGELLAFLGDSMLVAHNARFDFGFLNHELKLCGRPEISLERMIDTVAMARTAHPGAKHSLDALCTRYGIDRSHRIKHGALLDAELLAQVYIELTGGRQIGLGLIADEEGADLNATISDTFDAGQRPVRAPRIFFPTDQERERHRAFVAGLTDPIWQLGEKEVAPL